MKGRFRKGKKAFKSGRKDRLALRYKLWVIQKRALALKILMTAMSAAMSRAQIHIIQSKPIPFGTPEEKEQLRRQKALQITETAIESAQSIAKIWE